MIKGHGDDYGVQTPLTANFSTNIPLQCRNGNLFNYLAEKASTVAHYPDPDASNLAQKLAGKYGIEGHSVLVTNGATEAFYLLAEVFIGKHSLIFTPSFAEYEDACNRYHHKLTFESNSNYHSINPAGYDVVWICNPNNPDGKLLDLARLKKWLVDAPETIFILDEAYIELAQGLSSMLPEIDKFSNLVVVRSMTKRYVIPGLRLGFIAASGTLLTSVRALLMPWRINQLAIEAGNFITGPLYNDNFCERKLISESLWLQKEINQIEGYRVLPSTVNYFLVKGKKPAESLKKWLLQKHNILIRCASNFRGLDEYWFRIAVADRDDNILLLNALLEWSRI